MMSFLSAVLLVTALAFGQNDKIDWSVQSAGAAAPSDTADKVRALLGGSAVGETFLQNDRIAGGFIYNPAANGIVQNDSPDVVISPITAEQSDTVRITYQISDNQGDSVSLTPEYSIDGISWSPATVVGNISKIPVASYSGSLHWASKQNYNNRDQTVYFRLTPYDKDTGVAVSVNFHLDNSQNQTLLLTDPTGTQSGSVSIKYTAVDSYSDSLTVSCFYTTNGTTWKAATVDVAKIGAGKYSDTLHWNSSIDIGNANANSVRLYARVSDGWATSPADTTAAFAVANANRPTVSIAALSGEKSDKVTVNYTLADADNDTLSFTPEYTVDGATWVTATVSGARTNLGPSAYAGSFQWLSNTDLPGADVSSLKLRIIPSDPTDVGSPDTVTFHLDNNDLPSIALSAISTEQSGDVTVSFTLSDPENDTLKVAAYLSQNGTTWKKATLSGTASGIDSSKYAGSVVWKSLTDSLFTDVASLRLRFVAVDKDSGGADTVLFHLDNFHGQSLVLNLAAPADTHSGDVDIPFLITDATQDSITISGSYSTDAGNSWQAASLTGQTRFGFSQYVGAAHWATGQDLGNINNAGVLFRLFPNDGWADGKGDTTPPFLLVNQGLPSSILAAVTGEKSDTITFSYTLSDEDADTLLIVPQYSTDGLTWKKATVTGKVTGIDSAKYQGSVKWISKTDLPGMDAAALQFRIVPVDVDSGAATPVTFHLDNNAAPSVVLAVTAPEKSDTINVGFQVTDVEGDTLHASAQYSLNGSSWAAATLVTAVSGVGPANYTGVLRWASRVDLPNVDADSVRLRIFPADNDTGRGDTVLISLDNSQQQSVLITTPSGVQSGDVSIVFGVTDPSGDSIVLRAEYSKDGGTLWLPATLKTHPKVGPAGYLGTLVWNSAIDVGNINHPGIKIRVFANDGWGDGPAGLTNAFQLTNQGFPTVALTAPSGEKSDTVTLKYVLSDADADTLKIVAQYSADGLAWKAATVTGRITGILPSQYTDSLRWASAKDLPGSDLDSVQFRLIPVDQDSGAFSKVVFHLDNNAAPVCSLPPIPGEKTDSIAVAFRLTDKEKDTVKIAAQYYDSTASAWLAATLAATPGPKDSAKYNGSLVWLSAVDFPKAAGQSIRFRVIPMDRDTGKAGEIRIAVRQNFSPLCTTLAITGVRSDTISITYHLSDREGDTIRILPQFFDSVLLKWTTATVVGDTSGLDTSEYTGILRWASKKDRPAANGGPIRFRIIPSDLSTGTGNEISILVQNGSLPLTAGGKTTGRLDGLTLDSLFVTLKLRLDTAGLDSTRVHLIGTQSDTIAAGLRFVLSGDSTKLILTPEFNPFPFGGETLTVVVDSGLSDTAGKTYGAYSYKVAVAYLGDFNFDGKVNAGDLSFLASFWHKSAVDSADSSKEIGPVGGTAAPNLYPMPDGKFDWHDLEVFGDMWRWAKAHGLGRALAKESVPESVKGGPVSIDTRWSEEGFFTLSLSARGVKRLNQVDYRLEFDPKDWRIDTVFRNGLLTAPNGIVHSFHDADAKGEDLIFLRLSDLNKPSLSRPFVDGSGVLPCIRLRPLRRGGPLTLIYQLTDFDHHVIATGRLTDRFEAAEPLPPVEGLIAYPVPAYRDRDRLSFRFSSEGFTRATLKVYDLYGNLAWEETQALKPVSFLTGPVNEVGPFDLTNLSGRTLAPGGYIAKIFLSGSGAGRTLSTRFAVR